MPQNNCETLDTRPSLYYDKENNLLIVNNMKVSEQTALLLWSKIQYHREHNVSKWFTNDVDKIRVSDDHPDAILKYIKWTGDIMVGCIYVSYESLVPIYNEYIKTKNNNSIS